MSNIIDTVKRTVMGDKTTDDHTIGPDANPQRSNVGSTGVHETGAFSGGVGPHTTDPAGKAGSGTRHTGGGTSGAFGSTGSTNVGPHDSNMANKLDPRVDSDRDNRANPHSTAGIGMGKTSTTTHGTHSTAAAPHNSNIANKLDPRVDSDRDGSHNTNTRGMGAIGSTTHGSTTHGSTTHGSTTHGSTTHGSTTHGSTTHGSTTHGSTTHGSTTHGSTNAGSTNAGPHNSSAANKLDPRVDSDRDGSHNTRGMGAIGSTTHGSTTHGSTNAGPHNSSAANKLDPRVDSDRDGSHNTKSSGFLGSHNVHNKDTLPNNTFHASQARGSGTGGLGMGATTHQTTSSHPGGSTNAGPHNSNVANKMDPRVDSDRDRSHNTHAGSGQNVSSMIDGPTVHGGGANRTHGTHNTHGTTTMGTHNTTHGSTNAGPHNSNVANKMDPRVDSDRDGSHNTRGMGAMGGNNTTGARSAGTTHHGPGGLHSTGNNLPGPAPNTAGPHKSDLMNKLDPRVDSDRDGSKTIGSAPKY